MNEFPGQVRLSCSASGGMSWCNLPTENKSIVHLPLPTAFLPILTAVSVVILQYEPLDILLVLSELSLWVLEKFCVLVKLRLGRGKKCVSLLWPVWRRLRSGSSLPGRRPVGLGRAGV